MTKDSKHGYSYSNNHDKLRLWVLKKMESREFFLGGVYKIGRKVKKRR